MKTLTVVLATLALSGAPTAADTVNFDGAAIGLAPAAWTATRTGTGDARWTVERDNTAPSKPNVLKQSGVATYPVAVVALLGSWLIPSSSFAQEGGLPVLRAGVLPETLQTHRPGLRPVTRFRAAARGRFVQWASQQSDPVVERSSPAVASRVSAVRRHRPVGPMGELPHLHGAHQLAVQKRRPCRIQVGKADVHERRHDVVAMLFVGGEQPMFYSCAARPSRGAPRRTVGTLEL